MKPGRSSPKMMWIAGAGGVAVLALLWSRNKSSASNARVTAPPIAIPIGPPAPLTVSLPSSAHDPGMTGQESLAVLNALNTEANPAALASFSQALLPDFPNAATALMSKKPVPSLMSGTVGAIWDDVWDAATSAWDWTKDLSQDVVDAIHKIPGMDWAGEQLKDFAHTAVGHTFLFALATAEYMALAPVIGAQLAAVSFAIPGVAKGDNFAKAWYDETLYRIKATAKILLGDIVKDELPNIPPEAAEAQQWVEDHIPGATKMLMEDIQTATNGTLDELKKNGITFKLGPAGDDPASQAARATAQAAATKYIDKLNLQTEAAKLGVREDSLQRVWDGITERDSFAGYGDAPVPNGPKVFDTRTGVQILPFDAVTRNVDPKYAPLLQTAPGKALLNTLIANNDVFAQAPFIATPLLRTIPYTTDGTSTVNDAWFPLAVNRINAIAPTLKTAPGENPYGSAAALLLQTLARVRASLTGSKAQTYNAVTGAISSLDTLKALQTKAVMRAPAAMQPGPAPMGPVAPASNLTAQIDKLNLIDTAKKLGVREDLLQLAWDGITGRTSIYDGVFDPKTGQTKYRPQKALIALQMLGQQQAHDQAAATLARAQRLLTRKQWVDHYAPPS